MRKNLFEQIHLRLLRAFGPQGWWPADTPFEVMLGAVLTQNTNWQNVERAIENLKAAGALEPAALARVPQSRLAQWIKPSGYFNVKAQRLRAFLAWYMRRTGNGSVKNLRGIRTSELRAELLSVNGIGPETADSILLYALGRRRFVVDAYTRRFLLRHNLITPTASYDNIRLMFEQGLPNSVKLYNEFHALIVNLGKNICRPKNPRCDTCPLRKLLGKPELR